MSDVAGSAGTSRGEYTVVCEWMYRRLVSGSNDPPGQFAPPTSAGTCSVASGPSSAAQHRRREERPDLVALDDLERFRAQRRREVDQVVDRHALPIERRRLGRERLRRAGPLLRAPSTAAPAAPRSARSARRSRDSSTNRNACFVGCASALTRRPFMDHVEQDRRARQVVVPDAVMRQSGSATCACRS